MLEHSCKWSGTRPKHPCVLLPSHLAGSDEGAGGVEGCCQDVFWHEGQAGLRGRVRHKVVSWGGLPCLIYGTLVEERGGGGRHGSSFGKQSTFLVTHWCTANQHFILPCFAFHTLCKVCQSVEMETWFNSQSFFTKALGGGVCHPVTAEWM